MTRTAPAADGPARALASLLGRNAENGHPCPMPDYDRRGLLPRLLPLAPADLMKDEPALTRSLVRRLARALRAERRRGRAGLPGYDLRRHFGLALALRHECQRLAAIHVHAVGRPRPSATVRPLASSRRLSAI
ncbi:MAG: hypothetical protein R3D02_06570 [Hyphomicrobiales bacterium]